MPNNEMNRPIETEGKKSLVELATENPIQLIEKDHKWTADELKEMFPGKNIFACDLYLKGIESSERFGNYFRDENVVNIDHHSNLSEMEREVSATNLAIDYVNEFGPVTEGDDNIVVISHTDCDSILSSLIMRGILPPDTKFGEAAIAADHTGEENEIADLLQALQEENKTGDLEFSLRNLQKFLDGEQLEDKAVEYINSRKAKREKVRQLVESGSFKNKDGVNYTRLESKIDSELLPAYLPEAEIILLYSPHKNNPDPENITLWEAKTRLGMAAPEGLSLKRIMAKDDKNPAGVDPAWGGRWNAGSDAREGGTTMDMEEYVSLVAQKLAETK